MNTYRIFAGGDFQVSETLKINPQDIIMCADKGLNHAKNLNIIPDIVVGDFDSYKDKLPENIEIFYSVPEKDDTDKIWAALADPTKTVVVQTAPSVRATLGECFGMPIGSNV